MHLIFHSLNRGIDFIEAASARFVREQVFAHSLARSFHSRSRSVLHVKQYSIKPTPLSCRLESFYMLVFFAVSRMRNLQCCLVESEKV